jgi:hypothetical protein
MEHVTATYELSEDAFMRGADQLWAHRAMGRRGNYVVAALIVVLALALLWQNVPGWWGWGLLSGAAVFVGLDIARDRMWRRAFRKSPKYQAPITAILSDTGVGVRSAEGENVVPWAQFQTFVITRDFMILNVDQRSFSLIPRTAFETPSDHAQAEVLLKTHLKPLKARLL